jgi:pantoate--beta-alanine ligase
MQVITDIRGLEAAAATLGRAAGLGGVLVPTMGALHAGHAALIRHGAALARQGDLAPGCIVSIFVNPTQFNDPGDLARYPRTLEEDLRLCEEAGAEAVFAPGVETIYPPGATIPVPPLPRVGSEPGLEDGHRPGHFAGVCQVVMRLFRLLQPEAAIFGEKDWQQLQVISAMVDQAHLAIKIISMTTIRDRDGLAMSSRNRLLSPAERSAALAIPRALAAAGECRDPARAEGQMRAILEASPLAIEYAVVRDARTLAPVMRGSDAPARALIAARAGSTRLIDNAPWPARQPW